MHFNDHIVNIIGKLISPYLYPNTLDIEENCFISIIEIDDEAYENFTYIDVFYELINREKSIIPLGNIFVSW